MTTNPKLRHHGTQHHFKPNSEWTECLLCGLEPGAPEHYHIPRKHWEYSRREHINNLVTEPIKIFTQNRYKLKLKPKQPKPKIRKNIMKQIDVTGRYTPMPDLEKATDEALLEWYNKHSGSSTQLAKFASREVAVKKCSELKDAMDQLAAHANADAKPKTKGERKTKKAETMKTKTATAAKGKGKKATAKGKGKSGNNGTRESSLSTMVIKKLTKENPRREGSHGYKSFALIRDGMTYREFIDKGGRNKDLRWDIDAGHLKLVPGKK